ncbi:MAG: hypothetical protein QOI94_2318 [Acidobacteriaceae bacterium]|jgi:hypothetical protein|nr:hypothetical protein [Acidobacteriaceae bacterium]
MPNRYAVALWVASLVPGVAIGQQASSGATPNFTIDQAVTCSVHDAWELGGKTEAGFFAIVQAEAELAAQKRGLVLPDNETVGRQFGEYIKTQAKADHDQLLYAIVDRAVRKYGTKQAAGGSK